MPARVGYYIISGNEIEIKAIRGTIWAGAASEFSYKNLYLRDMKWNFLPEKLLTGDFSFFMSMYPYNGYSEKEITFGLNGITIKNIEGKLPADTIGIIAPYLGIRGNIDIKIKTMRIAQNILSDLEGTIIFNDLLIEGLTEKSLGDYRLDLNTKNNDIRANIINLNGDLKLEGEIILSRNGAYVFEGEVASLKSDNVRLNTMLSYLGSAGNNGMRKFRFEGEL
jgi:phage-related protein